MAKETKAQKEVREAADLLAKQGTEIAPSPLGNDANAGAASIAGGEEKPEKKGKTVEIEESVLEKILKKQEDADELAKKQAIEIEILREVADKGRLNKADQTRADGKLLKTVRLSKLGDKYVVGWKRIKDEVYTDERGVIHEDQVVEYYFHNIDKENPSVPEQMSDVKFSRNRRQEDCEVVGENKDRDGKFTYIVLTKTGLELPIDITFIN